jgi:hypothetical protein
MVRTAYIIRRLPMRSHSTVIDATRAGRSPIKSRAAVSNEPSAVVSVSPDKTDKANR